MANANINKPSYDYKESCKHERYVSIIESLQKGLHIGPILLRASRITRGRFREEINISIMFESGGTASHIGSLKVFCGRKPAYRPWVELFDINNRIVLENGSVMGFFDTPIEDSMLELLSKSIGPGESLFIEYYNDEETLRQLEYGAPPHVTRLGVKLLKRGFTWFKVWYYPEGFYEGGQKLQAEKPLDDKALERHLSELAKEIEAYTKIKRKTKSRDPYMLKTLLYSKEAMRIINNMKKRLHRS